MAKLNEPKRTTVRLAGLSDQPASDDSLGFAPYVNALFNFLEHEKTLPPFTLTIEGDWGSGKSSFMLQLQKKLKEKKRIIINFNAWRHDKVESMWAAFALTFIRQLDSSRNIFLRPFLNLVVLLQRYNWRKGWSNLLLKLVLIGFYITLVKSFYNHGGLTTIKEFLFVDKGKIEGLDISKLISSFGFMGLVIGGVFFLRKITDIFGNPLTIDLNKYVNKPDYEERTSFIESFHSDFDKAVNVLAVGEKKVYVFIDDLDRAEIPKAAELMQGLNMMISNSPKIIFIIGMDREKVVAGISLKYEPLVKALNTNVNEFGNLFIQKFIQLSFRIPSPTRKDVKAFIDYINDPKPITSPGDEEEYEKLLEDGDDANAIRTATELLARYFESNPRLIKQFINAFRLKCHIAHNTGLLSSERGTPLTIPQVGKFVAMTLLWPEVIDYLISNPGLIKEILTDPSGNETFGNTSDAWRLRHNFVNLLKSKPDADITNDYEMTHVNYTRLIETSPAIPSSNRENEKAKEKKGSESPESVFAVEVESFGPSSSGTTTQTTTGNERVMK
jgi:hypothetical protein